MSERAAGALVPRAFEASPRHANELATANEPGRPAAAEPADVQSGGSRLRHLAVASPAVLPARERRIPLLFLLVVGLPLLAASLFLGFVAADRYTSQTSFVIREGGVSGGGAAAAGGIARNDDSAHAVVAYVRSRAAAADLSARLDLRAILSRPEGDILTRYPRLWADDSAESLHHHLQDVVDISLDTRSGIATLSVLGYRPQDAQALAEALLGEAEKLVNAMNARASEDAVAFARELVAESEGRMRDVQASLSRFRNSESMLDPGAQSAAQLALMTELTRSATALDTEIAQLRSSAALNPRLRSLEERRAALASQVEAIRGELAGSSGSLAPRLSRYELLDLDRELALRALTASYRALEEARQEASASRLYLQRISAPSLADRPSHPRSALILALVAALALALYAAARLLVRSTMEHRF